MDARHTLGIKKDWLNNSRINCNIVPFIIRVSHIYTRIIEKLRNNFKILSNKKYNPNYTIEHVTIYSAGNAGDTALSSSVRRLFQMKIGKISWDLFPLRKKVSENSIQNFNKCDALIIGGGGLFIPDTNPNNISGWQFACSAQQYDKITKPIIVFAVGYNYFKGQKRTKLFEKNISKLVEKSAFFGLRNKGSVKEIQTFLDEDLKNKVVYQPCPTMIARYLYPNLPEKRETRKVTFNVAMDRVEMRMGEKGEIVLDQIAQAMQEISRRGYEVHFITHMDKEIDFLRYMDKYNFPYKFHSAATWDMKHLASFYNQMDVVIGMRGHGVWIPFGVNCQIISLASQEKTKWFLEDINALDWYIDILQNPETLCSQIVEKFIDIHELNGQKTTKRLIDEQRKLYQITCKNMKMIQRILEGQS